MKIKDVFIGFGIGIGCFVCATGISIIKYANTEEKEAPPAPRPVYFVSYASQIVNGSNTFGHIYLFATATNLTTKDDFMEAVALAARNTGTSNTILTAFTPIIPRQ